MERFLNWIETKWMPPFAKLSELRHLRAIRDGIIATLPLIIIGSLFLIIASPPVPSLEAMVKPYAEDILIPYRLTLGLMALYALFSMGYSLARSYDLDGITGGLLSAATFIMATLPVNLDHLLPENEALGWLLPVSKMGGSGLFMSIIAMFIAVETMHWLKKSGFSIKMHESVPSSVSRSFEALIPAACIILLMWIIRVWLEIDLHNVLLKLFSPLVYFAGNTFLGAVIPVVFIMLLWCAGIHGVAVVGTVLQPIWFALLDENAAAAASGQPLPNMIVEPFYQWFVWIGGSGTTLSLCLLLLFSKSSYLRQVGRFSIVPSLFNINEPVIFGVPIVMNPLLVIPAILAPVACTVTTYLAFSLDWIQRISILAPWTLPAPFGAYVATGGDWRAILLVFVNILLSGFIYYPFFKAYEKKMRAEENATP